MTFLPRVELHRHELGDWQTPYELAAEVVALLARRGISPRTVIEPTCGEGAFLVAARRAFGTASLVGFDLSGDHLAVARAALGERARLEQRDFFAIDWAREISALAPPVLVLGNPPWVTNAVVGARGGTNLPSKRNDAGARGIDAITGASNFDISEAMVGTLLDACVASPGPFVIALLVKRAVARKIAQGALSRRLPVQGSIHRIDARRSFRVSVDAALLLLCPEPEPDLPLPLPRAWPEYATLDASAIDSRWALVDGRLARLTDDLLATRHLEGRSAHTWRSGLKHDCAAVMELERGAVDLEETFVFPLLKGTDLARGRSEPPREVVVPQRTVGEDTSAIATLAPRTWAYLEANAERLGARRSRVYEGRPRFSIFGVGPYAFAPYKVAISGLHKRLTFVVVPPFEGRPVMLDDTCYFLPCDTERDAVALHRALTSDVATAFFEARVSWDEKRPIQKSLLSRLAIESLL